MHIAIEGIDGVGKSSAAKNLADELGFTLVEKPLKYLFDENGKDDNYIKIRDYVNEQSNKIFTSWFYGLGNIFLYHKFKGENVVTDRHLLSNYCWSGAAESEPVFDCLADSIGNPDFTFLIYANPEIVTSRITKRDKNDPDLKKVEYIPIAYRKMNSFLKRKHMKHSIIDSSNLNEQQVIDLMIKTLKKEELIK